MNNNRAQITIDAVSKADAGVAAAKKDLRELGNAADRSGKQTKKSFREATVSSNSFSGSIQQLHTKIMGLGAVAATFAVLGRASEQFALSLFQTRRVFGKMADQIIAKSKEMAEAINHSYSSIDIQYAFRKIHDSLERYGLGIKKQENLIKRAMDVAASRGLELRETIDRIESAMRGEAEASEYLGLTLSETYMKTTAFGGALSDVWEKLTEGEKARVRYLEFLEQSDKYTGKATEATETMGQTWRSTWNKIMDEHGEDLATINKRLAEMAGHLVNIGISLVTLDKGSTKWLSSVWQAIKDWNERTGGTFFDSTDFYITPEQTKDIVASVQPVAEGIASEIRGGVHEGMATVPDEIAEIAEEAAKRIEDTELGKKAAKELEARIKLEEREAAAIQKSYDRLKDFLAIHSQADDAARKISALNIEYDRIAEQLTDMQLAGLEVVEMSEQLDQWYANSMDEITNKTETTTDTIYDTWSHMYERLQDITADWVRKWKIDCESIVDLLKDAVAQMISAWIWGQQNMQFASSGQGGFSFANMFGGSSGGTGGSGFGGITSDIGQAFVSNRVGGWVWDQAKNAWSYVSGGALGASGTAGAYAGIGTSAYTAPAWGTAYAGLGESAYTAPAWGTTYGTTAAGESIAAAESGTTGWGAAGTYVSYAGLGYLIGNIVSSVSGDETHPEYSGYGGAAGGLAGGLVAGAAFGAKAGSWGGYIGAAIGAIIGGIGGALFGGGREHRPHAGITTTGAQWNPLTGGFGYTGSYAPGRDNEQITEQGLGWAYRQGGKAPEGLAQVFEDALLDTAQVWETIFTSLSDLMGDKGEAWLHSLDISLDFTHLGTRAAEQGQIEDWVRSLQQDFFRGSADALTGGMGIVWESTKEDFAATWNILSDAFKSAIEAEVAALPELDKEGDWETELAKIDAWIADIGTVRKYLNEVIALTNSISEIIALHGYSESTKSAMQGLKDINNEFQTLAIALQNAGVDLEKYTDLQIVYNLAIEDWINKAFVGAISYASTSQGWRQMAPHSTSSTDMWLGQAQHVQDLATAHDGTTASAIDLSDALGVLSGMSYDLAAEIQSAISSIHESYSSAIESMYLETLSDQQRYDYYRAQVDHLYADLPGLTSAADIQQYTQDILQYSQSAYALMSDEQKQQYFAQYRDFLTDVEQDSTTRLESIGDAMDKANKDLIDELKPLLTETVAEIKSAAELIRTGGEDVAVGGAAILDAAETPVTVNVNLEAGGEVG